MLDIISGFKSFRICQYVRRSHFNSFLFPEQTLTVESRRGVVYYCTRLFILYRCTVMYSILFCALLYSPPRTNRLLPHFVLVQDDVDKRKSADRLVADSANISECHNYAFSLFPISHAQGCGFPPHVRRSVYICRQVLHMFTLVFFR